MLLNEHTVISLYRTNSAPTLTAVSPSLHERVDADRDAELDAQADGLRLAGSPSLVLQLVPYDRHHVATYHAWMASAEMRTLTASEPLALDDEYAMQESWRKDVDKLTFILLAPEANERPAAAEGKEASDELSAASATAGGRVEQHDALSSRENGPGNHDGDVNLQAASPELSPWQADEVRRMVGDVNLFISAMDDDEDDGDDDHNHDREDDYSARNHAGEHDGKADDGGGDDNQLDDIARLAVDATALSEEQTQATSTCGQRTVSYGAEVELMIAEPHARRRGLGRCAVLAILRYALLRADAILSLQPPASTDERSVVGDDNEHDKHNEHGNEHGNEHLDNVHDDDKRGDDGRRDKVHVNDGTPQAAAASKRLARFSVKVGSANVPSLRLFQGLGFAERAYSAFFDEHELVYDITSSDARQALAEIDRRLHALELHYTQTEGERIRR